MRTLPAFVTATLIVLGSLATSAVVSISFGLPDKTRGVEGASPRGPASYVATPDSVVVTLVATIRVGGGPFGVTYDSGNGYVYVANAGTDNVSVISGIAVVATIPVGGGPFGVAYDGDNGYVYVTNSGSNTVSIISGTSVVAEVPVGRTPFGVGYDSGNGYVYVTNRDSNTVSVISDTTVIGTVPVGSSPFGVGYDSGNGYVYVTNYGSGTVSVMSVTVVSPSPPASTFLGLPVVAGYALLAGIVVLVVVSVVYGLRRLRRKQVIR